jgi:asparagine synthase (glutamine-hydrolysing)
MCGIAGLWGESGADARAAVEAMTATLVHRGPDDTGVWLDAAAGLALGHRRLSILDLSPAGHQPMVSHCGRYVVAFNGEIYNHLDIREELEAAGSALQWRGHSDTETILAAVARWGVVAAVKRMSGMFAFALWDRKERTLSLVRDRIGEKPLYYGWMNDVFLFGSELKALRAHPAWRGEIDRDALALFLRYCYVPAPYSIYRGIRKLAPGSILTLSATSARGERPDPVPFWSATEAVTTGQRTPFTGDTPEAVAALDSLLRGAIKQQMIADVPLGAFLSGGIDSSAVVALMQAQSAIPVKTFTIGFREDSYNEAQHAKAVARHLGTDHTELYLTAEDALAVVPKLPALYDEPFADSSQIPTHLIAQLAQRHVKVSLSGDGGDEIFGGYTRYPWTGRLWRAARPYPRWLRSAAGQMITGISPAAWDRLFDVLGPLLPRALRHSLPGDKMHKAAGLIDAATPEEIYLRLTSQWTDPAAVVIAGIEPAIVARNPSSWRVGSDIAHSQMYLDLISYLPDDILVKVDRAAMGVSLETRVPFLDHRVVEFAWRLPLSLKIRGGQEKWLLRQLLYRYVPRELVDRPKMGFGLPLDSWLRGPLRDWAEDLLDESRLIREGYFQPNPIRQKWAEHLARKQNWSSHLWSILVFQMWHKDFKN